MSEVAIEIKKIFTRILTIYEYEYTYNENLNVLNVSFPCEKHIEHIIRTRFPKLGTKAWNIYKLRHFNLCDKSEIYIKFDEKSNSFEINADVSALINTDVDLVKAMFYPFILNDMYIVKRCPGYVYLCTNERKLKYRFNCFFSESALLDNELINNIENAFELIIACKNILSSLQNEYVNYKKFAKIVSVYSKEIQSIYQQTEHPFFDEITEELLYDKERQQLEVRKEMSRQCIFILCNFLSTLAGDSALKFDMDDISPSDKVSVNIESKNNNLQYELQCHVDFEVQCKLIVKIKLLNVSYIKNSLNKIALPINFVNSIMDSARFNINLNRNEIELHIEHMLFQSDVSEELLMKIFEENIFNADEYFNMLLPEKVKENSFDFSVNSKLVYCLFKRALSKNGFEYEENLIDDELEISYSHDSVEIDDEITISFNEEDEPAYIFMSHVLGRLNNDIPSENIDNAVSAVNKRMQENKSKTYFSGVFNYDIDFNVFTYDFCEEYDYRLTGTENIATTLLAYLQCAKVLKEVFAIMQKNDFEVKKIYKYFNNYTQTFGFADMVAMDGMESAQFAANSYCSAMDRLNFEHEMVKIDDSLTKIIANIDLPHREITAILTIFNDVKWYKLEMYYPIIKYKNIDLSEEIVQRGMSERELFEKTMRYKMLRDNLYNDSGVFTVDIPNEHGVLTVSLPFGKDCLTKDYWYKILLQGFKSIDAIN